MERATLVIFQTNSLGIVAVESNPTTARALLDHKQASFAQRLPYCSGPVADPWLAWLCSGPFTDNPPHAKSPAVHNTDRILDSIILPIQISYSLARAIHEFSLQ